MRLLLLAILLMTFTGRAAGQTLHLLLASDVEDAKFGMISLQDEERMTRLFGAVETGLGYKMQTTYLNKTKFTGEAVRKTIANLAVQPDDIIVFFYSGLGYYPATSKSKFPFLQVKESQKKPLSLDEVGTLLQAKKVRFCMAMADCRNESLVMEPEEVKEPYIRTIYSYPRLFLNHFFLKKCGLMTIASTARNQKAYVVTTSEVNPHGDKLNETTSSLFTRLLIEKFNLLNFSNLNNLEAADFDTLLQRVQMSIPSQLNPTSATRHTQTVVWKTQPYTAAVRPKITEYPTWSYPKNLNELEKTLNQLIAIKEADRRKAMISMLIELYMLEDTSKKKVVKLNNSPDLSFKKYLERLPDLAPKLKKIVIESMDSREENIIYKNDLIFNILEIKVSNP